MFHQHGRSAPERELLYGRQTLRECLRARRRALHILWVADGVRPLGAAAEAMEAAREAGVPVRTCPKRDLDRWTRSANHQGLALEAGPYPYVDAEELVDAAAAAPGGDPALVLVLDHMQDPQNVGALLRSADAAGVQGVLIPEDRAAGITAAVVRASSGAAEHLPVARVRGLAPAVDGMRRKGIRVYGLEHSPEARPLYEAPLAGPVALVIGSEGAGLSRSIRSRCDGLLCLPMRGRVASLNASVAGALAMFEVRRQRGSAPADAGR